jgi:anti-sigma regulatory factor (Ser/Thr protein kinase)
MSVAFEVAARPEAVRKARQEAVDVASRWGNGEVLERTRLLVSELVTNCVVHGRGDHPVKVVLCGDEGKLHVEVRNQGPGFVPRPGAVGSAEGGGFGLFLVEQLADRWGISSDGFTSVWFELEWKERR